MSSAVVDILKADTTVFGSATGTASRIYLGSFRGENRETPGGNRPPYIEVTIDNTEYNDTKDGISTLDVEDTTVRTFGIDYDSAMLLANKVKNALDKFSGTVEENVISSVQIIASQMDEEFIDGNIIPFIDQQYRVLLSRAESAFTSGFNIGFR